MVSKPTGRPTGRPCSFTPELGHEICSLLSEGNSLVRICKRPGMPSMSAVFDWLSKYPLFAENYTRARDEMVHYMAEETLEIADSATAQNYNAERLKVDTRKWFLSKMQPKKYGEATQIKLADADGQKIDNSALVAELLALSDKRPDNEKQQKAPS